MQCQSHALHQVSTDLSLTNSVFLFKPGIIDTVGVPKSAFISKSVSQSVGNHVENLLLFY